MVLIRNICFYFFSTVNWDMYVNIFRWTDDHSIVICFSLSPKQCPPWCIRGLCSSENYFIISSVKPHLGWNFVLLLCSSYTKFAMHPCWCYNCSLKSTNSFYVELHNRSLIALSKYFNFTLLSKPGHAPFLVKSS